MVSLSCSEQWMEIPDKYRLSGDFHNKEATKIVRNLWNPILKSNPAAWSQGSQTQRKRILFQTAAGYLYRGAHNGSASSHIAEADDCGAVQPAGGELPCDGHEPQPVRPAAEGAAGQRRHYLAGVQCRLQRREELTAGGGARRFPLPDGSAAGGRPAGWHPGADGKGHGSAG